MTHIAKQKLKKSSQKKLIQQFVALLAAANETKTANIFSCLFTEAEQIMFIKRLAVVLMLDRGYSRYRIAQTLIMSQSTIKQFAIRFENDEFAPLVQLAKSKTFDAQAFWNVVEIILRGGLPPRTKDKWKYVPGMGR